MKEERFLKLTYIHDIATIVSIFLSVFHVMKGTGSKIRDVLCGSFLVMQIFAALKIGARFLEKKNPKILSLHYQVAMTFSSELEYSFSCLIEYEDK